MLTHRKSPRRPVRKSGKQNAHNLGFTFCCINCDQDRKSGRIMLSRCANVQCSKPFLRLREGKLFLVETDRLMKPGEPKNPPFVRARQQQRHVEHFWLCDECAALYTLVYDPTRGVALAPLRRPTAGVPASSAARGGVA